MQPIRHAADPGVPVASWVAGLLALMVGLTYAVVSGYWAVGGTVGLDTVGGVFEQVVPLPQPHDAGGMPFSWMNSPSAVTQVSP